MMSEGKTFVSWCYNQAGKSEPRFAGCEWQGVPWFQSHGQWGARGYNNLAPGDAIFFDWDLDGTADHVGIVIGTDGSRVYTVEGNSGDACKIKSYDLNYQSIKGYPMTYIQNGDYLIPDLKLSQQPEKPLGKYGRMRKTYLKEHRPILYNQMLLSEKLYPHLLEIDETAQSRLEQMMPQLTKEAGATEELKASDPMKWVGLMNTCKAQAEEILMAELINS